jgi:glycosyltransferase involved in cell wall biosynthesis
MTAPLSVLMLTPMEPYPPIGGARSVYYGDIEQLHARGHRVRLLSLTGRSDNDPANMAPIAEVEYFVAEKRSRAIRALGNLGASLPFSVQSCRNELLLARALELIRGGDVDVVVLQELPMAEYARFFAQRAPIPVYYRGHTVMTAMMKRFAARQSNPVIRIFASRQAKKCERFEAEIAREVDCVSQISYVDAEEIGRASGVDPVHALFPSIDLATNSPGPPGEREPLQVIHCGTLEPITTLPAMLWFAREVWPRIRERKPEARLDLVGRTTPSELSEMEADGVRVVGPVDDMLPHLRRGAVFISPMFAGSGIRLSILNAMATGNAIVATSVAAEGVPFADGHDLFIADEPAAFSDAVCRLLDDEDLRRRTGEHARSTLEGGLFSAEENGARLEAHLREAIANFAAG